ncbi:arylsulfatase b [Plakobranchus ocellatus]|uniref:Arylsulfatase b n=1 Tax=Plakobranchus ocellatus TaxID=259542 RepID=A0AAV4DE46_9GAST|nr:arylsulfatase b [Plakobranchus ocellatus]
MSWKDWKLSGHVVLVLLFFTSIGTWAKPPHIVFMVADDLGWNDIGFNNPDIISPNINQLAQSGLILNHSYVQPMCSPSRSAFMTGWYPFRLGTQHNVIFSQQNVCLPLDKTLLPQVLKQNGYKTHAIGKWHLGFCKWECTPTYRGFDTFQGYYTSREDYYTKKNHVGFDFHKNKDVVWEANGTYSSYLYSAALEKVIGEHDPNDPLFLYFPIQSVHEPLEVPEHYYNLYPNVKTKGRRIFSGMVTALDDAVGHLVNSLKMKGMYNDTLIFFTADNGGWIPYHGNNFPLRGGKISLWEGGTRVPAFVHGKGVPQGSGRFDGLMHAVDWFPTIVEAAGLKYEDPNRDGVSLWKSITHLSASPRTEMVYNLDNRSLPENGHAAIRVGDMKLVIGFPGLFNDWYKPEQVWTEPLPKPDYSDLDDLIKQEIGKKPDWKIFRGLFDLAADPYEHQNLYWQKPDVVAKLKGRLQYHYSRMIPANYPPADPASDPKKWNGTWSPGWC